MPTVSRWSALKSVVLASCLAFLVGVTVLIVAMQMSLNPAVTGWSSMLAALGVYFCCWRRALRKLLIQTLCGAAVADIERQYKEIKARENGRGPTER